MLGMSGGVDSSAAALLLKRQGYDVCGVTMLLAPQSSADSQDVTDARSVCEYLGIEHRVLDLRSLFYSSVIEEFAKQYKIGNTPNPCITCNRDIKFGAMLDYALDNGCDYIATGHYAKIIKDETNGHYQVFCSDRGKDQSYVLWMLTQRILSHVIFPIGEYVKEELRELAHQAGLPTSGKKDSQDICFVPDGNYKRFLYDNFSGFSQPGNFVDSSGNILGTHKGIENYTVGQRKGLGISLSKPMYVVAFDSGNVVLGPEGSQYSSKIVCSDINIIDGNMIEGSFRARVKPRYAAAAADATITIASGEAVIVFDEPQRALTPGQSAVFYDNERLVGGAIIKSVIRNKF